MTETKVRFKKMKKGSVYLSDGYYVSERDFEDRNPTLIFIELTKITRPIPKKKDEK